MFACNTDINQSQEQPKDYNKKDIQYGENATYNIMDLYRTDDTVKPVVMLIHGGAWMDLVSELITTFRPTVHEDFGRSHMEDFKDQFLENDYHVVNIDYRLVTIDNTTDTKVTYIDMLDDIKSAVKYLKDNAKKYSIDTSKMVMYGYSAGGHLALLYSYKVIDSPIPVKLVVSRAGPTDFTNETFRHCDFTYAFGLQYSSMKSLFLSFMKSVFSIPEDVIEEETIFDYFRYSLMTELLNIDYPITTTVTDALDTLITKSDTYTALNDGSPVYHVNANVPHTLMLYGGKDTLVSASLATALKEKLDQYEVPNSLTVLANSVHSLDSTADTAQIEDFNQLVENTIKQL